MGYKPAPLNYSQLHVKLGSINTIANYIGTDLVVDVTKGFSFQSSDVGCIVFVYGAGTAGIPKWTVIDAYVGANQVTVHDAAAINVTSKKVCIFRDCNFLANSIHGEKSLSNPIGTFNFDFRNSSLGITPLTLVGRPVLVTHDVTGDEFGGYIEAADATNYPGHTDQNQMHVECVSWDKVLASRNLFLSKSLNPNRTDTFQGDGTETSVNLSAVPTGIVSASLETCYGVTSASWAAGTTSLTILSHTFTTGMMIRVSGMKITENSGGGFDGVYGPVTVSGTTISYSQVNDPGAFFSGGVGTTNGIASITPGLTQAFALEGTSGFDWYYSMSSTEVKRDPLGGGLLVTSLLIVTYSYAAQLDYYNETASSIASQLVGLVANEGITVSVDDTGPTLAHIQFTKRDSISSALEQLMSDCSDGTNNYAGYVSPRMVFHFEKQGSTRTAPFSIDQSLTTDGNALINIKFSATLEKYVNGALVDIGATVGSDNVYDGLVGDGSKRIFQTRYPIGTMLSIYRGPFNPQTFGIQGDPVTGKNKQWYWSQGSDQVTADAVTTTLTSSEFLGITYLPLVSGVDQSLNQTAITERYAIEAGSGEHDSYVSLTSALPLLTGTTPATLIAQYYAAIAATLSVVSLKPGLVSGQAIAIDLPEIGATLTMVVDNVQLTDDNGCLTWTCTLISGALVQDWKASFRSLSGGGSSVGLIGGVGGVSNTAITSSDDIIVDIAVTAPLTVTADAPARDGQRIVYFLTQDGTGHDVTWGDPFEFPFFVNRVPNSMSVIEYIGRKSTGKFYGHNVTGVKPV